MGGPWRRYGKVVFTGAGAWRSLGPEEGAGSENRRKAAEEAAEAFFCRRDGQGKARENVEIWNGPADRPITCGLE